MKRIIHVLGVFFCLFLAMTATVYAAPKSTIDVTCASEGYFSVYYEETDARMKVGVTCAGQTTYYNYTPGTSKSYTFTEGDGNYTVTLYRNVSGTSYKAVANTSVAVTMNSTLAPYLASTAEITFAKGDAVSQTAVALCQGKNSTEDKLIAMYNYISENFTYDYALAAQVKSGAVKNYTPDTGAILASRKGVCYDLSALFAAMCRSQDIPCALVKGQMFGGYHAWNMVYVNDQWVAFDLTVPVSGRTVHAESLTQCIATQDGYYAVAM